jgi:hypothetical protein
MSDYGRQWEAAGSSPEDRLRFQVRTLQDSLQKHKDAMAWIVANVGGGEKIVKEALSSVCYDPDGPVQ